MKRLFLMLWVGVLAGCSAQSVLYEPPAAAEAKVGEEGVIFLVVPKAWKESPLHSCAPLTLVGEPRITTQSFGPVSKVEVAQVFRNDTAQTVDADWKLPMPPAAAVMAAIMDLKVSIGTRHFRAVAVEAEQASALYAAAIQQGKHAAMAQVDEAGGLHLRLGRIRAGERVETAVTYAQRNYAMQDPFVCVRSGERVTVAWKQLPPPPETKPAPPVEFKEDPNHPGTYTGTISAGAAFTLETKRESGVNAPDKDPEAFPLLAALEAHEQILCLLALDRASGRPDHAKQAYELACEAKIVSPVSSLLMVDAKGEKKAK